MTFAIDPDAVIDHANALGSLQGNIHRAETYLNTHLSLTIVDTALLFAKAIDAANDVKASIAPFLTELHDALQGSSEELGAVAQRSLELDDAVEAELDAAYPDSGTAGSGSTSAPTVNPGQAPPPPEDALVTPTEMPEEDLIGKVLTTDWLSPSTLIAEVIELFFDWNYLDEVGKKLGGDWDRLYQVSEALNHLSGFVEGNSAHINFNMQHAALSWNGNASDAAAAFFTEMAHLLDDAAAQISTTSPEFETVANGIKSTASLLQGLFSQIMDVAIASAVCYAAGAATSWTGVGAIIGFLSGSGALAYAVWLVSQAWEVLQAALTFFDALSGAVGALQQFMIGQKSLPMPHPYDNPTV